MKMEPVIKAVDLVKTYRLFSSGKDRVKEALSPFRKQYHKTFNALDHVSFSVEKGQRFGIIGENGSGKSTLVQIVAGVLGPTSGHLSVKGRVAALLELGAGFNPELTGRENIFLNGTILGMDRREIEERLPEIVAFADIGTFLEQPVKTYSSGMFVRLAFSIASSVDPDILIVDEALAVGDIYFQHKCMHRMKTLMNRGVTILFVSHDMGAVRSLCDRAILLDHGKIMAKGDAEEVVNRYTYRMINNEPEYQTETTEPQVPTASTSSVVNDLEIENRVEKKQWEFIRSPDFIERTSATRAGSGEVRIQNVVLYNSAGEPVDCFNLDESICLRVFIEFFQDCDGVNVGFVVRSRNGAEAVGTNCNVEKKYLKGRVAGTCMAVDFCFRNVLQQGTYSIATAVGISDESGIYNVKTLDWVDNAAVFKSEKDPDYHLHTLVKIPVHISILD